MNRIKIGLALLLIGILSIVSAFEFEQLRNNQSSYPDIFVGIDVVSDSVEYVKQLVDKVKNYTNLIVIGSTEITFNETKLDSICQYIYKEGLYFVLFFHPTAEFNQLQWFQRAKEEFGNLFLGVYAFDEIGGHQVDCNRWMLVEEAQNYTDAADKYLKQLDYYLKEYYENYLGMYDLYSEGHLKTLTADYALYWFTYNSLCDVILAEYAWNHSRPLHTALVRGAATIHNKEWGAMITWTYRHPPYIESGSELYEDMVYAYQNGAKYIVVFNYPKEGEYGVLADEHFDALERFWQYASSNPRSVYSVKQRSAYVLPKDYGWGFRSLEDKIWGIWGPDELSEKIWKDTNYYLNLYQSNIDIIYDDPKYWENVQHHYNQLIFWNQTELSHFPLESHNQKNRDWHI